MLGVPGPLVVDSVPERIEGVGPVVGLEREECDVVGWGAVLLLLRCLVSVG